MLGAILLIVVMILFVPMVIASLGGIAAVLGTFLKDDAEQRHEGSELIELNK